MPVFLHVRLLHVAVCLFASLTVAVSASCASSQYPTVTATATTQPQPTTAASYGLPTSLKDEVSHTPVIVIAKVTGIGGVFSSARTGDSMGSAASPTCHGIAQVYDVSVERYLKGSGPNTIHPIQIEGAIRAPVTPTVERIRAAKAQSSAVPM